MRGSDNNKNGMSQVSTEKTEYVAIEIFYRQTMGRKFVQ
jgi:hypothetical protein